MAFDKCVKIRGIHKSFPIFRSHFIWNLKRFVSTLDSPLCVYKIPRIYQFRKSGYFPKKFAPFRAPGRKSIFSQENVDFPSLLWYAEYVGAHCAYPTKDWSWKNARFFLLSLRALKANGGAKPSASLCPFAGKCVFSSPWHNAPPVGEVRPVEWLREWHSCGHFSF